MVTALIFDFDGLILDTETAEICSWQNIYAEYGYPFPHDEFIQTVGGYGISNFDAALHLHDLTHGSLNADFCASVITTKAVMRFAAVRSSGVANILTEAKHRNMKLAVASSSPHSWVDAHLTCLGLISAVR